MGRVIPHPRPPGDDGRDPGHGPQRGGEAVGRGAFQQRRLHLGPLLAVETRLAAGPADRLQPPPAFRLPRVIPPMRGRAADAQLPRHGDLRHAPTKQPRGLEPPRFQRRKIPVSTTSRWHDLAWQSTA